MGAQGGREEGRGAFWGGGQGGKGVWLGERRGLLEDGNGLSSTVCAYG